MPRFAANLSMTFNEVPFLERFAAARGEGFEAVEFLFPYAYERRQLADVVRAAGVKVALFNMPPGNWEGGERGLAIDAARRGEFQDGVGAAIAYAKDLGCDRVHCMAGIRPAGADEARLREVYVANLKFAAAELRKHGLELLIEAINTRDIPGYYLTTTRQAFDVIRDVDAPNLSFQFDIYHVQVMEGDLTPKLERHIAQIGHIQLADTPGRHEPGTGEINYEFLFQRIDAIGYTGWIGCEYRPATTTLAGLGWARRWLRPSR